MATDEPDVPLPHGAQRVDPWETSEGTTFRYFESDTRGDTAEVKVGGFQNADGTFSDVVVHIDVQQGRTLILSAT
ncbi:MAG: hypothetical protein K2X52_06350 [Mycobacteriaceae bacterium]|nr:hypothetical protein [Mycobacteriaceae bacterium]